MNPNKTPEITRLLKRSVALLLTISLAPLHSFANSALTKTISADMIVFDGTPGGIMTAVSAKEEGMTTVVVEPQYLLGGVISGGLVRSDTGDIRTVGGYSIEFFRKIRQYYIDTYGEESETFKLTKDGICFEPSVAEKIFVDYLDDNDIDYFLRERLEDVEVVDNKIVSITTKNYQTGELTRFEGKYFVDASYEGDLMAGADVPYVVGREGRSEYGEPFAGMNRGPEEYVGRSDHRVQAYNLRSTLTNDPNNMVPIERPKYYVPEYFQGTLNRLKRDQPTTFTQAFPAADPVNHHGYGWGGVNGKFDVNSADYAGANYTYAEGDYETREHIYQRVRDYWLSLWYMIQNDPSLSEEFRASAKEWGLPKDEFKESGHVSPQIYVRVARRMLGRYFMTQNDTNHERFKPDTICIGTFKTDSHVVQKFRYDGQLMHEGWFLDFTANYEIPYRMITPYDPDNLFVIGAVSASHVAYGSIRMEPIFMMMGQAAAYAARIAEDTGVRIQNVSVEQLQARLRQAGIPLEVPFQPVVEIFPEYKQVPVGVAVQFEARVTHQESPIVKYWWNFDGTGRVQSTEPNPTYNFELEKTYRVSLIVEDSEGNKSFVREQFIQAGSEPLKDVIADMQEMNFPNASRRGQWRVSVRRGVENYPTFVVYDDANKGKGENSIFVRGLIEKPGRYEILFSYGATPQSATNVPVAIRDTRGRHELSVNQRDPSGSPFRQHSLGVYTFDEPGYSNILVETGGTDGTVNVGEFSWVYVGEVE